MPRESCSLEQLQQENLYFRQENYRLAEEVKQLIKTENELYAFQEKLDRQLEIYQKLYQLGKAFQTTFKISEALTLAIDFLNYDLNFQRCLIWLRDPQTGFKVSAQEGYYDEELLVKIQTLTLTQDSDVFRLISAADPLILNADISHPRLTQWGKIIGMEEFATFPLQAEDSMMTGFIVVGNTASCWKYHTRIQQNSDEVIWIANLASQMINAIKSLQYFESVQEQLRLKAKIAERTQALQEKNQSLEIALSELKQTQAQLIQTEKMSSLGEMISGIAHEINNPIGFVQGNIEPLREYFQDLLALFETYQSEYPKPSTNILEKQVEIDLPFLMTDLENILNSIHMGTQRIHDIVLSLRNYSRLDETAIKDVDIHEGIESTLMILNHRIKHGVEIIKNYGDLPSVRCSPSQLNQVFTNIIANALDAMFDAQSDPKQLTITTQALTSNTIQVRFRDTGPGMSPEVKQKIFDPFFTTKPVGKGTGLGMGICFKIIEQHRGKIEVVTAMGEGTEFLITLPIDAPISDTPHQQKSEI